MILADEAFRLSNSEEKDYNDLRIDDFAFVNSIIDSIIRYNMSINKTKVEVDVRNVPIMGDIVQKRALFAELVSHLIYIGYKVSFNGKLIIEWK
jgi:hypothetical protein